MGMSAAVTMDTGMFVFMRRRPHYQLSGWIKAWFILFDYPDYSVIRQGSGTKVSG